MYSKRQHFNTLLFILLCVLLQVILFSFIFFSNTTTLRLEKVVILGRHHIRSPLSRNLKKMTPQKWIHWKEKAGDLTEKGYLLEGYMGKYYLNWLMKEGALSKNCPSGEEFYVYTNSMERTLSSAKAFISSFSKCNIKIHQDSGETDSIFNPIIHNSSAIFRDIALKEMENVLNELNLVSSYISMENILIYKDSEFCKIDNKCNLSTEKNNLDISVGEKPKVIGPLKISNEAIDAFLMSYYNGFPLQEIGWGKLNTTKEWYSILNLTAGYHHVKFDASHVAMDIARPLLKYMTNIFLNKPTKVTLLMGHDANINVLLTAMYVKPYKLLDSFVSTPIGGMVVFQKWYDSSKDKYYLKIEYVYQTNKQLRDSEVLTFKNPPNFTFLELEYCKINDTGLCLWDDFISFLSSL